MYRLISIFVLILLSIAIKAEETHCKEDAEEQAHTPVKLDSLLVCFAYVAAPPEPNNETSQQPDSIAIYSVVEDRRSPLIFEFPYAGTRGEILDVFSGSNGKKKLFVVHRFQTPHEWEVVGDMYSVNAFRIEGVALVHDAKLSDFFGLGGDLERSDIGLEFSYPFKSKQDVENALRSPLARAILRGDRIAATVKKKAYLYAGGEGPWLDKRAKKYLIQGDSVTVTDATEGWCKIEHASSRKTITMWLKCDLLAF